MRWLASPLVSCVWPWLTVGQFRQKCCLAFCQHRRQQAAPFQRSVLTGWQPEQPNPWGNNFKGSLMWRSLVSAVQLGLLHVQNTHWPCGLAGNALFYPMLEWPIGVRSVSIPEPSKSSFCPIPALTCSLRPKSRAMELASTLSPNLPPGERGGVRRARLWLFP